MVKKEKVEEMLFVAVALLNGFLDGNFAQEEFVEKATEFVRQPVLEEVQSASSKRAK